MTYRCGIGEGMAAFGLRPGPPQVTCDGPDCRAIIIVGGRAPMWLLNGKAPKGWLRVPVDEYKARHYCPACRKRERA